MTHAPRRLGRTAATCLVALLAVSCVYGDYRGIYWLNRTPSDQRPSVVDLNRELDRVLPEFGLAKQGPPCSARDGCYWVGTAGPITPSLQGLEGAGARTSVAVGPRNPSITIIDHDHWDETPFVHALKQRIEDLLKEHFGLSDPRFDQQRLLLVPNS